MTTSTRTATLELQLLAGDAVAGRLTDGTGRGADFVGWLGLAGAIEALTAPAPAEACLNSYLLAGEPTRPGSPVFCAA